LLITVKMSPFTDRRTMGYCAVRLASEVAKTTQCALKRQTGHGPHIANRKNFPETGFNQAQH
jgi:hypothetical protein